MARTDTLGHFLTDVADAIREKGGTNESIQASEFDTAIENLPSGGGKYAPTYVRFGSPNGNDLSYETSNLDTSNMVTMQNMFYGCNTVTSLDCSGFLSPNLTKANSMFYNCTQLLSLDLRQLTSNDEMEVDSMFANCNRLQHLDIRSFDFTNNLQYTYSMFNNVPNNCEIIVADATQKQWLNTNFSRLTNVKTVAEYEAE